MDSSTPPNSGGNAPRHEPGGVSSSVEVLECRGIEVEFEGLRALAGVDLVLRRGTIKGLIGTNGAGKTTLVNVLSGYQKASAGEVELEGRRVTGWSPERLARHGIVRTFQAGRIFPELTVLENVQVAGICGGLSRTAAERRAVELLEFGGLISKPGIEAGSLGQGEIRILGILRCLATSPTYLLADEPAAGSNDEETERLLELLREVVSNHNIGLLVIEHDMTFIMKLCPEIQVLDHGTTIALGAPAQVRTDPEVLRAYLSSSAAKDPEALKHA